MEIKKTYQADLEHRRGWFFLIGLAVSACLFAISLAVSITPGDDEVDAEMLEKIVQDMEFKPNKPVDNMIAYQVPEPQTKEVKAKINVVEKPVLEEVPEQLVKSQEAQLDGEGAKKEEETTKAIVPVANKRDVAELSEEIIGQMQIIYAEDIDEVFKEAVCGGEEKG